MAGAELEAVDVWVSEFSQLFVLSVVMELLEAANVDARRVGDSSVAVVEFSLKGPLNHELPQENKPTEGTKQRKRTKQAESGAQLLQTKNGAKTKAKNDEQSKNRLMDCLCFAKGNKTNISKLSELPVSCLSLSL